MSVLPSADLADVLNQDSIGESKPEPALASTRSEARVLIDRLGGRNRRRGKAIEEHIVYEESQDPTDTSKTWVHNGFQD